MRDEERINAILSEVGSALLDKGEGYSIGQLVADLEGDGSSRSEDPYNVWDRHFLNDLEQMDGGWRDEPRDPQEVEEVVETFREYWNHYPDMRFCQIVCNAHSLENGMRNFDADTQYSVPIDELTDEQLLNCLERRIEKAEEDDE